MWFVRLPTTIAGRCKVRVKTHSLAGTKRNRPPVRAGGSKFTFGTTKWLLGVDVKTYWRPVLTVVNMVVS